MTDREYLDYLKILHGSFNIIVGLLFIYQGSLGLKIRAGRHTGHNLNKTAVKHHRRNGPILSVLGVAGYLAGVTLIYIDKGHLLHYPLHMIIGSCIALFIIITFIISRNIKGSSSPWRNPHFAMGVIIIILYLIQVYIGLNILF